jgi:hypothetical protein
MYLQVVTIEPNANDKVEISTQLRNRLLTFVTISERLGLGIIGMLHILVNVRP